MDYKVCILAAGSGTRMGKISDHINKAILPVNFKAVISYIIEKFPKEIEIVIALGHKKETVTNYLELAYPERNFTFVQVDKYIGPGTGPGYSLLQCKNYLQSPFIFYSSDTMVIEEVPLPNHNWFGIAPVKETENYCTIKIKNNLVYQLDDKIKIDNKFAFIGLAGIHDYKEFFEALETNTDIVQGEVQVSNGFKKLIEHQLAPIGFTWFDTGTIANYKKTNENFSGKSGNNKFDFSKGDEFLYFVNGKVIKFFANPDAASKRVERATTVLKGLCPDIEGYRAGFYSYKRIEGQTIYNGLNMAVAIDFFDWLKRDLWSQKVTLSDQEKEQFKQACHVFYYEKTLGRVNDFYKKTGIVDKPIRINGINTPTLSSLLKQVDWEYVENGIASNFHGDLHFDNALLLPQKKDGHRTFKIIDWRQEFGGITTHGDIYYDLAKMYGGILMSYQIMKEGKFSFEMSDDDVYYNFDSNHQLHEARELYEIFLKKEGYDLNKIKLITALIYINMAPLHHNPFDHKLHYLGRSMIHKLLNKNN